MTSRYNTAIAVSALDPAEPVTMSKVFTLSNRASDKCPYCASSPSRSRSVQDYTGSSSLSIVECDPCGIAWQWPAAWAVAEGTAFFDESYSSQSDASASYFDVEKRAAVAKLQMDFVAATCPVAGRLLDIGAGVGTFVKEAVSRGWDAGGIELSRTAVQAALAAGVNVIESTINDLPADHLYDAISMWDVIEHIDDPLSILRGAYERLRPGGWLFVETGNYQSASLAATGSAWWLWQADHRWYFSPPSLSALLQGVGFSNLTLASNTFRPAFDASREPRSSLPTLLKAMVRRPLQARFAVARHVAIQQSWARWPRWAHLPIFAVAARKPPAAHGD